MTIRELKDVTACRIYIERTDTDGCVRRVEYVGGLREWQVTKLKIIHAEIGFALCVELEEGGAA